jgi:catechol 2,3-dioxygenase-like lactoylglutathione lyase family enzyme
LIFPRLASDYQGRAIKTELHRSEEDLMARLSHVGLTVKNLERSLTFYRDVAGMNEGAVLEGENRASDTPFSANARMKMVHVIAGTFVLQLIEYVPTRGVPRDLRQENVGSTHISFYVPDVEAKYAEVKARGDVKITSPLTSLGNGLRGFYTEDPDGVPVEFVQTTK